MFVIVPLWQHPNRFTVLNCSIFLTTGVFSLDDNLAEADHPYSVDDDLLNEAEVNGNWTPQEKALHEARLKAKAKRRLRKSSSRNSTSESLSESGELAGSDPNSPKGKVNTNDRKSRTGKGRGLPKKGTFELVYAAFCHSLFTGDSHRCCVPTGIFSITSKSSA